MATEQPSWRTEAKCDWTSSAILAVCFWADLTASLGLVFSTCGLRKMNGSQRADLILWTLSLSDYLILLTLLKLWEESDTKEKKKNN